jgi:transitional endoplasmic reticulum ATPase
VRVELRVVFRRSGGKDFARALEFAERQPGFGEEASGEFAVAFNQDQLDGYDRLVELVGRWQHTRLYLNGLQVERQRLDHLLACYRARLASPDRHAYCAGASVHQTRVGPVRQLFPCRLIPISEANDDGWFHHGRLTRDGVFIVDKGQLRQAVAGALDRTLAAHCPALFPAEVDGVVDRLPDRIDPSRDARWVYREGWQNGRFMPIGVAKRADGDASASGDGSDAGAGPRRPPTAAVARQRGAPPAAGGDADGAASEGGRPPTVDIGAVRYADIGGLAAQIRVIRENLELPLRFPDLFERLGITPHRGILLSGPPGTGKTMLAKALATESEAAFLAINGPEILSKWRGESEANLRRVFEEARAQAPSVVLIDEIDAIAPDRSRVQHNHEAVLVSQLLTVLDGLADRGRVVVVATTNRPELVDSAVRRPGRLDLMLEIGLPDAAARADILRIHTGRMPLAAEVDVTALAAATTGFAGAHLGSLCREAGLECMREVVGMDAAGAFTLEPGALDRLVVRREHFERALAVVARGVCG